MENTIRLGKQGWWPVSCYLLGLLVFQIATDRGVACVSYKRIIHIFIVQLMLFLQIYFLSILKEWYGHDYV